MLWGLANLALRPSLKLRQRLDRKIFGSKRFPAMPERQFEHTPGTTALISQPKQITVVGKIATAGAGDKGVR
jgi:hypothetical protein